jgi:predicted transcriptional regulator of viral defense system
MYDLKTNWCDSIVVALFVTMTSSFTPSRHDILLKNNKKLVELSHNSFRGTKSWVLVKKWMEKITKGAYLIDGHA